MKKLMHETCPLSYLWELDNGGQIECKNLKIGDKIVYFKGKFTRNILTVAYISNASRWSTEIRWKEWCMYCGRVIEDDNKFCQSCHQEQDY